MPVAATCPSCGASLSETSVLALAPICSHCGAVITSVGGTLGLTSAYGVNDPAFTRTRVEADLAVFREYQMKYRGMLEACKQQLAWSVERYANPPLPPQLLKLEDVPSFWVGLLKGLGMALAWFIGSLIACTAILLVYFIGFGIYEMIKHLPMGSPDRWGKRLNFIFSLVILGGSLACILSGPFNHVRVKVANGNKPLENARRQDVYQEAVAAALRAAEPIKAAEDHRLRCQIRELEGLAQTVGKKEAAVRRILATL